MTWREEANHEFMSFLERLEATQSSRFRRSEEHDFPAINVQNNDYHTPKGWPAKQAFDQSAQRELGELQEGLLIMYN